MDVRAGGRAAAAVVVAALVVGCAPLSPAPTATPTNAPTTVPTTAPVPGAPGPDVVRSTGLPLGAAADGTTGTGALLPVDGAQVQVEDRRDGSVVTTVTGPPGTVAWVAAPPGGRTEHHGDGSVTVHDETGAVTAALGTPRAPDGTRGAWRPHGDVLALDAPTGSVTSVVGTAAVASATWGDADGGRSLLVVPADWVRDGDAAAQQALVQQVGEAEPEAASASVQAQLWCHVLGARDKASWNVEPWRPDVSAATMLLTRCNPTDADL